MTALKCVTTALNYRQETRVAHGFCRSSVYTYMRIQGYREHGSAGNDQNTAERAENAATYFGKARNESPR